MANRHKDFLLDLKIVSVMLHDQIHLVKILANLHKKNFLYLLNFLHACLFLVHSEALVAAHIRMLVIAVL